MGKRCSKTKYGMSFFLSQVVLETAKDLQTRFLSEHKGLSSVSAMCILYVCACGMYECACMVCTCVRVCMCVCVCICVCVCVCACVGTCMRGLYMCACVHVCVYMRAWFVHCVCVCLITFTEFLYTRLF